MQRLEGQRSTGIAPIESIHFCNRRICLAKEVGKYRSSRFEISKRFKMPTQSGSADDLSFLIFGLMHQSKCQSSVSPPMLCSCLVQRGSTRLQRPGKIRDSTLTTVTLALQMCKLFKLQCKESQHDSIGFESADTWWKSSKHKSARTGRCKRACLFGGTSNR